MVCDSSSRVVKRRFSVIVPSFQQGEYLERTLRSIFDQGMEDVEILVQDGGSTDGSVAILKRHEGRLRWQSKPDAGQTAAINEGMRQASGEFLCYLNSDDLLCEGALRRVKEYFAAHPKAQIVYGLADFIDERDQRLGSYPVEPWDYERLKETCFICQPACFWRRELWERFGPFDESLHHAMDYEYWLRVGAEEPFHLLPDTLARSRCHLRAKSFDQTSEALDATIAVLRRYHQGRIPPRWIVAYARMCGERGLRGEPSARFGWTRFAFTYWNQLRLLAPQVTAGGGRLLRRKIAPPYRSARRRVEDPIGYLRADLAAGTAAPPVG